MLTYNQIRDDYKKNSSHKECFYFDKRCCSGKIKRAHSIQKEKVLKQLEGTIRGNKMVYSFDNFASEHGRTVGLIPIGKNKASIFTGFCDYHDSTLFSPLENFDLTLTEEQCFLMTYRAFAHGFHQLMEMRNYFASQGLVPKFGQKDLVVAERGLIQLRIDRFLPYKIALDDLVKSKNFAGMNYHARIIRPFVPIACSSILSPFYTYKNVFLNPREAYSFVILNVLPDTDRTVIVLSHFNEDHKGKILFDELKELNDMDFSKAVSSLLIYCTGNTFISPALWDQFDDAKKKTLFEEMDYCEHHGDRITKFFNSEINFFYK